MHHFSGIAAKSHLWPLLMDNVGFGIIICNSAAESVSGFLAGAQAEDSNFVTFYSFFKD